MLAFDSSRIYSPADSLDISLNSSQYVNHSKLPVSSEREREKNTWTPHGKRVATRIWAPRKNSLSLLHWTAVQTRSRRNNLLSTEKTAARTAERKSERNLTKIDNCLLFKFFFTLASDRFWMREFYSKFYSNKRPPTLERPRNSWRLNLRNALHWVSNVSNAFKDASLNGSQHCYRSRFLSFAPAPLSNAAIATNSSWRALP